MDFIKTNGEVGRLGWGLNDPVNSYCIEVMSSRPEETRKMRSYLAPASFYLILLNYQAVVALRITKCHHPTDAIEKPTCKC